MGRSIGRRGCLEGNIKMVAAHQQSDAAFSASVLCTLYLRDQETIPGSAPGTNIVCLARPVVDDILQKFNHHDDPEREWPGVEPFPRVGTWLSPTYPVDGDGPMQT
jgi:hypothetical protein